MSSSHKTNGEILSWENGEALAQVAREAVASPLLEMSKASLDRAWHNLG